MTRVMFAVAHRSQEKVTREEHIGSMHRDSTLWHIHKMI